MRSPTNESDETDTDSDESNRIDIDTSQRKDDSEKIDDDDFDDDDDAWVKHYLENQEEIDKRIESMMVDDGLLTRSTEDIDERDPGDLHDVGMEEAVEDPPTATTPPNANSKKQKFHEFCNRKVESGQWNPSKPLPWKKDKELNLFVEDLLGEKGKPAAARWWRELKSAKGMLATVKVTAKKEDLLEDFKRIGSYHFFRQIIIDYLTKPLTSFGGSYECSFTILERRPDGDKQGN